MSSHSQSPKSEILATQLTNILGYIPPKGRAPGNQPKLTPRSAAKYQRNAAFTAVLCKAPATFSAGGQHARQGIKRGGTPGTRPSIGIVRLTPDALAHLLQRRVTQQQALLSEPKRTFATVLSPLPSTASTRPSPNLVWRTVSPTARVGILCLVHAGTVRHLRGEAAASL